MDGLIKCETLKQTIMFLTMTMTIPEPHPSGYYFNHVSWPLKETYYVFLS